VDIVIRVFPVTSTSLSPVFWGVFRLLYGVPGSVCVLSSSLFTRGFVNGRIVEPVLFRSSSLCRVYVDYYFYVGLDFEGLCAC